MIFGQTKILNKRKGANFRNVFPDHCEWKIKIINRITFDMQ